MTGEEGEKPKEEERETQAGGRFALRASLFCIPLPFFPVPLAFSSAFSVFLSFFHSLLFFLPFLPTFPFSLFEDRFAYYGAPLSERASLFCIRLSPRLAMVLHVLLMLLVLWDFYIAYNDALPCVGRKKRGRKERGIY